MSPHIHLELVHMQLTRECNLNCWFCGQRKKKAFNHSLYGEKEMRGSDWLRVIDSLISCREKQGWQPDVMLWGGEPLLCPDFDFLARRLYEEGFPIGIVTNGTLLSRHMQACSRYLDKIYLSIDGLPEEHNRIRGRDGWQKALKGIKKVRSRETKLIIMSVLTPGLLNTLPQFLEEIKVFEPEEIILQEMIGFDEGEITGHKDWLYQSFGIQGADIDAWKLKGSAETVEKKMDILAQALETGKHPFLLTYLPHGEQARQPFCLSPFSHLCITWEGETSFCTDYTDFSLGNVKEKDIRELFLSDRAALFREEVIKGRCITCRHCSWKNNSVISL